MKSSYSRRQFVKKSAINAIGLGVATNIPLIGQGKGQPAGRPYKNPN